MISEDHYEDLADAVRELGRVVGSLSGRVCLLDKAVQFEREYHGNQVEYYVAVESLEIDGPPSKTERPMRASAFITFEAVPKSSSEAKPWLTSFCGFQPGTRQGTIKRAVSWLRDYVLEYGDATRPIIADFDAYHSYFDQVDFPMPDRVNGRLSPGVLQKYAQLTRDQIIVFGDYVEGDQFRDITQSTIMNRSAYVIPR